MPFQIQWTRTEEDYVRAILLNQSSMKEQRLLTRVLMPATLVLLVVFGLAFGRGAVFVGFVAAYLVVVAIHFGMRWVGLPRYGKRVFRQQKSLHQPMTLDVSEEGIRARSGEEDQSLLRWQDAHHWVEGKTDILVFPSEAIFYMVPKHMLDDAELEELRGYLVDTKKL